MESIPQGYIKTKVGTIPISWNLVELGTLLRNKPKYGIGASAVKYSLTLPTYLRITDIDADGNYTPLKKASVDNIDYKDFILKEDEIVLARTGATVGKSYLYDKKDGELVYAGFLIKISLLKEKLDSIYLKQFLNSNIYWNWVRVMSVRSGQPGINAEEYNKLPIPLPSLKEQKKIASILTVWDSVILKQKELIELKMLQKKYLVEFFFNGDHSNHWTLKKLEDIVSNIQRAVKKPKSSYERLGLRSHAKGTFHEIIDNPETVGMDTLYQVKEKDLILNITFAWEHAFAIAEKEDENKLVSHRFPTYIFKDGHYPLFYKYLIAQPRFKYLLGTISPGGAGRNRVMSRRDFLKLKINVPNYQEQEKLAETLSLVDEEIKLLEEELFELKEQKQGLIQKLLTGKVRVKV